MKQMPIQFRPDVLALTRRLLQLRRELTAAEVRHALAPLLCRKLGEPGLLSRQVETLLRLAEEADHEKDSAR